MTHSKNEENEIANENTHNGNKNKFVVASSEGEEGNDKERHHVIEQIHPREMEELTEEKSKKGNKLQNQKRKEKILLLVVQQSISA